MNTDPEATAQREILPMSSAVGCPLQLAMEEIARVAVRQHVLYQEGECQPRPDLLDLLEAWTALHTLIRERICVASRDATISADDLEIALGRLLRHSPEADTSAQISRLRVSLAACARATSCPLGTRMTVAGDVFA